MKLWALVPVRSLTAAKSRLSGVLSPQDRAALAEAMLADVLALLASAPSLAGVLVVTADPRAATLARNTGASVLVDSAEDGLNGAVARGQSYLCAAGATGMLVVPADVPFTTHEELETALTALSETSVVIVPAFRDGGTNLLGLRPADVIAPAYGPDSAARHAELSRDVGVQARTLMLAGAGCDIDVADDLSPPRPGAGPAPRTRAFLCSAPAAEERQNPMTTPSMTMLAAGGRCDVATAYALVDANLPEMMRTAASRRDLAHGETISYSRKVFIPLTQLCRDVCHYCTFAHPPQKGQNAYLRPDEVLAIARAGQLAGCREALFTLGDKPELRYRAAAEELEALGYPTTLSYLAAMADLVQRETGLLPHVNPGLMEEADLAALRRVSVSAGIMLESTSQSLCLPGGPHHGSPDKLPQARLHTIERAGALAVPFTSGILIGIGETRADRIESLLALRDLHDRYGHLQEIIVQNFRPKPGTRMASHPAADSSEHLWSIAAARLIFAPEMSIQAPPNLTPGALLPLVEAGINDWGGVSPVTPDHVNPEAPWPHLDKLAAETRATGKRLVERLAIYPSHARDAQRWVDPALRKPLYDLIDADGWLRTDNWCPGRPGTPPAADLSLLRAPAVWRPDRIAGAIDDAIAGRRLDDAALVRLFRAREGEFTTVCAAADALRAETCGDTVSFVVTRNINYTNVCYFRCQFCAFSKGKMSENLRGRPYDLGLDEITRRVIEAWDRGATEVCMQGGIHPSYTGQTYLDIAAAVRAAMPRMHLHAFSPLEVWQGAETLGLPVKEFLLRLREAGLNSLPGTAAEILDDEVRATLCPDKINTDQWLSVMRTAHGMGLRSTATIMFGHVDRPENWARHLLRIRDLQEETGGFTEFVPLPFVHMEAPIYLKGRSRPGPTFREAILMHAVSRLALHPLIPNIQVSWVKMGPEGAQACLSAGVNDLGGTLMDESISRAAGASHGQEMTPLRMTTLIKTAGRQPRQRTTLYGDAAQIRNDADIIAAE